MKRADEAANLTGREPERWSDRSGRGTGAEEAIGSLFKRVRQATEPSDVALAHVSRRLHAPPRRRMARFVWRAIVATVLLIGMGGAVGAALKKWRRARATETAPLGRALGQTIGAPPRISPGRRGPSPPAATASPTVEPAPAEIPPPMPPPSTAPARVAVGAAPGPSVPARGASPGDATEADLLGRAFRQLRSQGDATGALRTLDQYVVRFPRGALAGEARIARAEALIALDRRAEALPVLETIEQGGGVLTRDVRVTRGELRATAGRCVLAEEDFAAVLAVTDEDAAGGRALYGRASCALLAGDNETARRDLTRYLILHAGGALAPVARRALDSLP